ncbi:MAG: DnaJ domain-containing protein, partial [Anaerovorax sp.]
MQNPYEVLGIKEGASQEEIKAAYREQVKKYHPDKFQNNPLYELAQEKLREANEAYDTLTKGRGNGSWKTGNGSGAGAGFADVRRTIDQGDLPRAEAMLNRISTKNAEWFYLNGMISLRKGWYDDALSKIQTASTMEPNNMEYRNAMNSIMSTGGGYRTNSYNRGYNNSNDAFCQALQCYCCADMC